MKNENILSNEELLNLTGGTSFIKSTSSVLSNIKDHDPIVAYGVVREPQPGGRQLC